MEIKPFQRFALALGIAVSAVSTLGSSHQGTRSGVTVHEWGTFTSIAGENGAAVEWQQQNGPADLPCFVQRDRVNVKWSWRGTVRMETPVLYFYTPDQITMNVSVRFRRGVITEWFPPAQVRIRPLSGSDYEGTIAWTRIDISPGATTDFPQEPESSSHYYTARRTDAAPIQVDGARERFLFYRGVGQFAPPISASVSDNGTAEVWSSGNEPIGDIVLFENRGGEMTYQARRGGSARMTVDATGPVSESNPPRAELVNILTANGLYEREAAAMVATWADSWFEEGTRLFYVVPRSFIDAVLPLIIDPPPAELTRVFIGRLELVPASTRTAVRDALTRGDRAALERHGRFLQPIAERVLREMAPADRARAERHLHALSVPARTAACR
jgi:hypothetical protein